MTSISCILCGEDSPAFLTQTVAKQPRRYQQCPQCRLVFVHPSDRLSIPDEQARYQCHQNDIADEGYRKFLSQLSEPLHSSLKRASTGLDYGCGPGPLLAKMLEEQGHSVALYDPLFYRNAPALEQSYDFVTCSETIEHFHTPAREFKTLINLVKPGGILALMTSFLPKTFKFEDWYYAKDPTHVSFYDEVTMDWIATTHGLKSHFPNERVCLLSKDRAG